MAPTATEGRTIGLVEFAPTEVELSAAEAAQIHAGGHVRVAPLTDGRYELRPRGRVGVVRYGAIELRIRPKVGIGRLLYLAAHGRLDRSWADLDAELGAVRDPLSALAHVLIWHAERALRPTPLQGYRVEETTERAVRGRVLFERQIARRAGVLLPVELRVDEFDLDIVENRVLLGALVVVEQLMPDPQLSRTLAHLRFMLDGVTPWRRGVPIPEIPWTRLNERYRPAVQLAKLLLDDRSLDFEGETSAGRGFVIDMPRVFEAFLETALGGELAGYGGRVEAQHPTSLDALGLLRMYPDLSWWERGECRAVVDAKYKQIRNDDYPNADVYQMLAYCLRLGAGEGWLVYADLDGGEPSSHVIDEAGVVVHIESIDLGGGIDDLNGSITRLASRIRG